MNMDRVLWGTIRTFMYNSDS